MKRDYTHTPLIMRSHQAPAAIPSKHGSSACPQWMKTLEQKYQRLHMKIVYSTNMVNSKYPYTSGRTGYDPRLLRATNKREISALSVRTSRKVSGTSDPGLKISQSKLQNLSDKRINMEAASPASRRQLVPYFPPSKTNSTEKETGGHSSHSSHNSSCNAEYTQKEPDGEQTFDLSMVQYDKSGTCETKLFGGRTVNQSHGHGDIKRPMKTPASRISNNTSKSCPAVMESDGAPHQAKKAGKHNTRGHYRDRTQHGKRHMKVFSRMSMEAQHAITETLKEMGMSRNDNEIQSNGDVNGNHGNQPIQRDTTSPVPNIALTKSFTELDIYSRLRPATPCESFPEFEAIRGADAFSDSEISLSPQNRLQSARSRQARLPEISGAGSSSRVYSNQNSKPCRLRLPGVGKYDLEVKREETFEITPPGFDVRYQHLTTCEERDSETPPLDIRERAIQKCSDWLAKHTPR